MTYGEGTASGNALSSHPYQPQFFLGGVLTECQTNYSSGSWVSATMAQDGPALSSDPRGLPQVQS